MHAHRIIIGLQSTALTFAETELLRKPYVAGVLLLQPNIENKEQLLSLTASIKSNRPEASFLITADFEAKRVWRAKNQDGTFHTYLPQPLESMRSIGEQYEKGNTSDRGTLLVKLENYAYTLGQALLECGINVNFAPVLDTHYEQSEIIGSIHRAFSQDPSVILACSSAMYKGFKQAGLYTFGKHWIDHGFANNDSHLEATIDTRSKEELASHIELYRDLISQQLLDGIMTAHVLYPSIDPNHVASRSSACLKILREDLGFSGFICSDCMTMKGAGDDSLSDKLFDAFQSGTNYVILGGLPKSHPLHEKYPLFDAEIMAEQTEIALKRISEHS